MLEDCVRTIPTLNLAPFLVELTRGTAHKVLVTPIRNRRRPAVSSEFSLARCNYMCRAEHYNSDKLRPAIFWQRLCDFCPPRGHLSSYLLSLSLLPVFQRVIFLSFSLSPSLTHFSRVVSFYFSVCQ